MLIGSKLDRSFIILRSTVVRVTERAIELALNDHFLTLTFHHASLDTLSAGNFIAADQIYGLFVFEIEREFADSALLVRGLLHSIY